MILPVTSGRYKHKWDNNGKPTNLSLNEWVQIDNEAADGTNKWIVIGPKFNKMGVIHQTNPDLRVGKAPYIVPASYFHYKDPVQICIDKCSLTYEFLIK